LEDILSVKTLSVSVVGDSSKRKADAPMVKKQETNEVIEGLESSREPLKQVLSQLSYTPRKQLPGFNAFPRPCETNRIGLGKEVTDAPLPFGQALAPRRRQLCTWWSRIAGFFQEETPGENSDLHVATSLQSLQLGASQREIPDIPASAI
jgi:hypothetical protein